jgi:hypothetical protein
MVTLPSSGLTPFPRQQEPKKKANRPKRAVGLSLLRGTEILHGSRSVTLGLPYRNKFNARHVTCDRHKKKVAKKKNKSSDGTAPH